MDIETKGLGAGSYPEPPSKKYKRAKGYAVVTYEFDDTFPTDLTEEEIYNYIEQNIADYRESYVSIEEFTIEEEVE